MEHLGTVTLETPRLLLRRFTVEDAGDMFRNWCSDPEVTHFLTWPTHESLEATQAICRGWEDEYQDAGNYNWGIEYKDLGQLIGSIGVVSAKEKAESVHIGYCLGRPWWNQGIMTEAFRAVIRFLMEEVGVGRIDSRHDARNPNSGKVMAACGLTCEGIHRQSDWNNLGIHDAVWYSLIREDYFKKKEGCAP